MDKTIKILTCVYCGASFPANYSHICEATHLPTLANKVRLLEERLRKLEEKQ